MLALAGMAALSLVASSIFLVLLVLKIHDVHSPNWMEVFSPLWVLCIVGTLVGLVATTWEVPYATLATRSSFMLPNGMSARVARRLASVRLQLAGLLVCIILVPLRLEEIITSPWATVLLPGFLAFYLPGLSSFGSIEQSLVWFRPPSRSLRTSQVGALRGLAHLDAVMVMFAVFLALLAIRLDGWWGGAVPWTAVFLPLFLQHAIIVSGLFNNTLRNIAAMASRQNPVAVCSTGIQTAVFAVIVVFLWLPVFLTEIMIYLRLSNTIDLPWWKVLIPLYVPTCLVGCVVAIVTILGFCYVTATCLCCCVGWYGSD